jgi:hypothetical protein
VSALLSRVVPAADRGMYLGLQQTFGGFARIAAPNTFAFLYDHVGQALPFEVAALHTGQEAVTTKMTMKKKPTHLQTLSQEQTIHGMICTTMLLLTTTYNKEHKQVAMAFMKQLLV